MSQAVQTELRAYTDDDDTPRYGGLLLIDCENGVAHCTGCDWRGVPTILNGVASTVCPKCRVGEAQQPNRRELRGGAPRVKAAPANQTRRGSEPGRNAPCPCGSGTKFKRCCGK